MVVLYCMVVMVITRMMAASLHYLQHLYSQSISFCPFLLSLLLAT